MHVLFHLFDVKKVNQLAKAVTHNANVIDLSCFANKLSKLSLESKAVNGFDAFRRVNVLIFLLRPFHVLTCVALLLYLSC